MSFMYVCTCMSVLYVQQSIHKLLCSFLSTWRSASVVVARDGGLTARRTEDDDWLGNEPRGI